MTTDQFELDFHLTNLEAERIVLGAILLEPDLIHECILQPEQFSDRKHKNILYILKELSDKEVPLEVTAIAERVGNDRMAGIGGISYLVELAASIPTTSNFNHYQKIILDYHEKRQTYEIARGVMQDILSDEDGQVRRDAIDKLSELDNNGMDNDDGSIHEDLQETFLWMQEDHGQITGAATGFHDLDNMLSGLQRQDLVIVGARPSMGKTALALNICLNYADKNKGPTGIFSAEMPKKPLIRRMISNVGNIDAQSMRNPSKNFDAEDWSKSANAMGILSDMPIHIFDKSAIGVSYIRQKCRLLSKKYPDEHIVIVVDYLQLIIGNPNHRGNRQAEISEISRTLKQIAREFDLTMIALSQLSRAVEQRQDKRPMMSDLRESGQIEQDADVIAFLYRDDYYDKESEKQNIVEIIIAKQRNGPTGTINLAFAKEFNKFLNIDYQQSMI